MRPASGRVRAGHDGLARREFDASGRAMPPRRPTRQAARGRGSSTTFRPWQVTSRPPGRTVQLSTGSTLPVRCGPETDHGQHQTGHDHRQPAPGRTRSRGGPTPQGYRDAGPRVGTARDNGAGTHTGNHDDRRTEAAGDGKPGARTQNNGPGVEKAVAESERTHRRRRQGGHGRDTDRPRTSRTGSPSRQHRGPSTQ